MESTTINYAGMTIDIDYDVDKHGDLECITDVTHDGVSIKDFCDSVSAHNKLLNRHEDLTYVLEGLVQLEIERETQSADFEGWRVGQ
jgi:hypothetical protein